MINIYLKKQLFIYLYFFNIFFDGQGQKRAVADPPGEVLDVGKAGIHDVEMRRRIEIEDVHVFQRVGAAGLHLAFFGRIPEEGEGAANVPGRVAEGVAAVQFDQGPGMLILVIDRDPAGIEAALDEEEGHAAGKVVADPGMIHDPGIGGVDAVLFSFSAGIERAGNDLVVITGRRRVLMIEQQCAFGLTEIRTRSRDSLEVFGDFGFEFGAADDEFHLVHVEVPAQRTVGKTVLADVGKRLQQRAERVRNVDHAAGVFLRAAHFRGRSEGEAGADQVVGIGEYGVGGDGAKDLRCPEIIDAEGLRGFGAFFRGVRSGP